MSPLPADDESTRPLAGDGYTTQPGPIERERSRFWKGISIAVWITVPVGSLILLGLLAFLWTLWLGDSSQHLWTKFVTEDWISIVITVTDTIMSWFIGGQGAIIISMLAALSLETKTIRLDSVLEVSMLRHSAGAQDALDALCRGRMLFPSTYLLIALVIAFTNIIAQFTSTLLFWDLLTWPGLVQPSVNHVPSLPIANQSYIDGITASLDYDRWVVPLSTFETFAEYSEPPKSSSNTTDTGVKVRAYLPISRQDDREAVMRISGYAWVLDTRVVCQAPELQTIRLDPILPESSQPQPMSGYTVTGSTRLNSSIAGLVNQGDSSIDFNCTASFYSSGRTLSVCKLPDKFGGLQSFLDPTVDPSLHWTYNSSQGWMALDHVHELGSAYMMFDLDLNTTNASLPVSDYAFDHGNNVWVRLSAGSLNSNDTFRVAICYDSFYPTPSFLNVTASSHRSITEPTLPWDQKMQAFYTFGVRQQLGALGNSSAVTIADNPDTLDLDLGSLLAEKSRLKASYDARADSKSVNEDIRQPYADIMFDWAATRSAQYCNQCHNLSDDAVNPQQQQIIMEILNTTDNPALVLQAQLTLITRRLYYDLMPTFPQVENMTTTSGEQVYAPAARGGIIIVTATVLVHLALLWTVTLWFCRLTRHSFLGNVWQPLGQISCLFQDPLFRNAATATDDEICKMLKEHGRGAERMALREVPDQDTVAVVNVSKMVRPGSPPESPDARHVFGAAAVPDAASLARATSIELPVWDRGDQTNSRRVSREQV